MGNPLRYSHGKMMPNDGMMRVPQSSQGTPDTNRLSNAQMQNLAANRNLRPSSEMLPMGQQGTPESTW